MRALVLTVALLLPGFAQQQPEIVPISSEPMHHLVLENEHVRVFDVTVPPLSQTKYHKHDRDYLFVTLGDTDVESTRVNEKPVRLQLQDGAVRFTKGGFAHKAVNLNEIPFHNITIEIKDSSAAPPCGRPQCEVLLSVIEGKGLLIQELGIGRLHWMTFQQRSRRLGFSPFAKGISALIVATKSVEVQPANSNMIRTLTEGEVFWKNRDDDLLFRGRGRSVVAVWVE